MFRWENIFLRSDTINSVWKTKKSIKSIKGVSSSLTYVWRRVDAKLKLASFAVVSGEMLQEQRHEAGSGSAAKAVEDQETLKWMAAVSHPSNAIQNEVHHLTTLGVVATSEVIGSILFTCRKTSFPRVNINSFVRRNVIKFSLLHESIWSVHNKPVYLIK